MEGSMVNRATARRPQREKKLPAYLAFAKVGQGWVKIGAAWKSEFRNGGEGFSLELQTVPLNWDGRFILAIPDVGEPEPIDE